MSKETIYSIIRAILMIAGALLIGHHIWNTAIDATVWDAISGSLLSFVTLIWGVVSKETSTEAAVAGLKQFAVFAFGLLASSGKISPDKAQTWISLVGVLISVVFSIYYKANPVIGSAPADQPTIPVTK
jgi:putative effector of murein hydrolase LrgA (UPF0299 family)